jgi:hypothetical protein
MSESTERSEPAAERPRREPRQLKLRHVIGVAVATALFMGPVSAFANHQFPDVPNSNLFHDQIDWMSDTGITTGFPDGTFKPNANVTRGQMSAFMFRLYNLQAGLKSIDVGDGGDAGGTTGNIDTWVTVPGASATVTVPAGTTGRILGTFTSEAQCNFGDNIFIFVGAVRPQCMARILINGATATPADFVVADSNDAATEPDNIVDAEAFTIQSASAAGRPPGTYTLTVQIQANDANANTDDELLISLQDWLLEAEVVLADRFLL